MSEVLSQDEIEQLLAAIASGEIQPEEHPPSDQRRVLLYDFRVQNSFNRADLRFINYLLTPVARLVANALSDLTQSTVTGFVCALDQRPWRSLMRHLPDSAALAVISLDPMKGPAVVVINPLFRASLLDLLFGGKGEQPPSLQAHTDIEQSVLEGVVPRMLGGLREAWSTAVDLRPRLITLGAGPHSIPNLPPDQMMAEIAFEFRAGKVRHIMDLVIPASTFFPILPRLRSRRRHGRSGTSVSQDQPVTVELTSKGEQLPLKALGLLRRGQRIRLASLERSEFELRADGLTIARLRQEREGSALILEARRISGGEKPAESIARPAPSQEETPPPAREVVASSEPSVAPGRPFDFVTPSQVGRFVNLLSMELPQTAAAVLAAMEPAKAAEVLTEFPEDIRVELVSRIGTIGFVDPEVVREVERVMEMLLAVPAPRLHEAQSSKDTDH